MDDFKKLTILARAIAVPARLHLLQVLGENGLALTDAAAAVGISPATAHAHLVVLQKAGLVSRSVKGRKVIYGWGRSRWQFVRQTPPAPTMPTAG